LENPVSISGWDYVIDPLDIRDPKSLIFKIFEGKDEISECLIKKIDQWDEIPTDDEQISIYCAKLLNDL